MALSAYSLNIERKHRRFIPFVASMADFSCTSGEVVNPEIVLANPDISLYCLDDATKRAIFVELPPGIDLAGAPFVYQTQYDHAQRLIAVPYDTFRRLAHALPAVDRLIVVYGLGRSGSTLVSHLLNALNGMASLSEPDVATQFVHLRRTQGEGEAALRDLLDCTVRLLSKPGASGRKSASALKLRTHGLLAMDLYQTTFPEAKNLFLYREATGFAASFYRLLKRFGAPETLPVHEALTQFGQYFDQDLTHLSAYLDPGTTDLSIPQQFTLMWLAAMEWYLAQYARGIPILAVRYDDLNAHREQVLTAILQYCGLPITQVPDLLGVFARDAQAGTALARDNPEEGNQLRLCDGDREAITRIVQRHPVGNTPDFIVPGTLCVYRPRNDLGSATTDQILSSCKPERRM
jgi:hypothetical protein